MKVVSLILVFFFVSFVLVMGDIDRLEKQSVPMKAQIAHILTQMPKDTRLSVSERVKYAVYIYTKLLKEAQHKKKQLKKKEEEKKKYEKGKKFYEQFLAQRAKSVPFLWDFSPSRLF